MFGDDDDDEGLMRWTTWLAMGTWGQWGQQWLPRTHDTFFAAFTPEARLLARSPWRAFQAR